MTFRNIKYIRLILFFLLLFILLTQLYRISRINYIRKNSSSHLITRCESLQKLLKCQNRSLTIEKIQHGIYWVIKNLIVGLNSRHMGCAESITYTTNGDFTFFDNLETVAMRWLAPISFAVYAPGYDMNSTLDAIQYVRNCLAGSHHIRDFVSFHVYFPHDHMPEYVPLNEVEALTWPYSCVDKISGESYAPPFIQPRSSMYKTKANLTYPINVGRNIARQAVNTHFIFACDIEVYPILNFVNLFLDMVYNDKHVLTFDKGQLPRVYPMPVFEIKKSESVPNNKSELRMLIALKRAQLFHVKFCPACHRAPHMDRWIQRESNVLSVISWKMRIGPYKSWEPFYVSDNTEPMFDERVTWEGKHNKRVQAMAMCYLGYRFHTLDMAFLVHKPGIKSYTDFISHGAQIVNDTFQLIISKIKPEYEVLYGKNKFCDI